MIKRSLFGYSIADTDKYIQHLVNEIRKKNEQIESLQKDNFQYKQANEEMTIQIRSLKRLLAGTRKHLLASDVSSNTS